MIGSNPEVGDLVIFRNSQGIDHQAFTTAVHGTDPHAAVNVAFLCKEPSKMDGYGREIHRGTSVNHVSEQGKRLMSWRWPGEEMPEVEETKLDVKQVARQR